MQKKTLSAFGVAFVVAAASAWSVTTYRHDQGQDELLARAKLSVTDAQNKAMTAVPGGTVSDWEIEEEDGRLIYSFELKVGDQIQEVEVDANSGEVLPAESEEDDDRK